MIARDDFGDFSGCLLGSCAAVCSRQFQQYSYRIRVDVKRGPTFRAMRACMAFWWCAGQHLHPFTMQTFITLSAAVFFPAA